MTARLDKDGVHLNPHDIDALEPAHRTARYEIAGWIDRFREGVLDDDGEVRAIALHHIHVAFDNVWFQNASLKTENARLRAIVDNHAITADDRPLWNWFHIAGIYYASPADWAIARACELDKAWDAAIREDNDRQRVEDFGKWAQSTDAFGTL